MTELVKLIERQPTGAMLKEKLNEVCALLKEFVSNGSTEIPEVMTAPQVQAYLQISNQTFYNLKNEGIIKTVSIGGNKRYLLSQIKEMLIEHMEK